MKICIVAEGCYPYAVGGVSGWINSMIKAFPEHEFIILAIVSERSEETKFSYELPENVTAVYESYLNDYDWGKRPKRGKRTHLTNKQYAALRSLILDRQTDWATLISIFQKTNISIDDLLMGADFLHIVEEYYDRKYSQIVFSDFLWTMRSIYLPMFLIMKTKLPEADVYHCVATGYAGLLGGMAKYTHGCGLIISEHGIYTREREEEILKARWVEGVYKNIWINQFRKMSMLAYESADIVTSLYSHARELQIELGCNEEKTYVVPNGITVENFSGISGKRKEDEGYVNIGAILRVAPIKDIKTMLRAYAFAKAKMPYLRLWIMGPEDEEEYAKECHELVDVLQLEDVIFTGRIDVTQYLGRMDFTILTSISEGQPLTILESFAAGIPVVATDVGNCRELIYGEKGDEFGTAGILCHVMNVQEIAEGIRVMVTDPEKRREMGEIGFKRVNEYFRVEQMKETYGQLYEMAYDAVYEKMSERWK